MEVLYRLIIFSLSIQAFKLHDHDHQLVDYVMTLRQKEM